MPQRLTRQILECALSQPSADAERTDGRARGKEAMGAEWTGDARGTSSEAPPPLGRGAAPSTLRSSAEPAPFRAVASSASVEAPGRAGEPGDPTADSVAEQRSRTVELARVDLEGLECPVCGDPSEISRPAAS